jgi:hypothetical protein
MTSANLIAYVRARIGKLVGSAEIEDADITNESVHVLSNIAEWIPVKKLRSITSVANQRSYDVHADTKRVQKVFLWGSVSQNPERELFDFSGGDRVTGNQSVQEYYNFPSLWMIDQMRIAHSLPKISFDFHPIERKLNIDPMPTVDGDLYYYISIETVLWILSSVPSDFEDLVVFGTAIRVLQILMLRRSQLGGIQRQGGMVDYPSDRLKLVIDDWKTEYQLTLSIKAKLYCR